MVVLVKLNGSADAAGTSDGLASSFPVMPLLRGATLSSTSTSTAAKPSVCFHAPSRSCRTSCRYVTEHADTHVYAEIRKLAANSNNYALDRKARMMTWLIRGTSSFLKDSSPTIRALTHKIYRQLDRPLEHLARYGLLEDALLHVLPIAQAPLPEQQQQRPRMPMMRGSFY